MLLSLSLSLGFPFSRREITGDVMALGLGTPFDGRGGVWAGWAEMFVVTRFLGGGVLRENGGWEDGTGRFERSLIQGFVLMSERSSRVDMHGPINK